MFVAWMGGWKRKIRAHPFVVIEPLFSNRLRDKAVARLHIYQSD